MPECDDRRLTTVSRTGKRDGFNHFRGAGGHGPEGLFHQQAKALIMQWVAARWPSLTVAAEQSTSSKTRRTDVMVTGPAGPQVAIEVQYYPLKPDEWRERHQSYRDQGVTAVWLLGHLPPHLHPVRHDPGRIELGVLHTAMLEAGVAPLWINPITEQIGACWSLRRAHECLSPHCAVDHSRLPMIPVTPTGDSFPGLLFDTDRLDECELHPDGLHTPITRWLADCQRRYDEARDADRRRQEEALAEREAARHATRQELQQQAARVAAEGARFKAQAASYQRALEQRWLRSELRAAVLRRYGAVPEVLCADPADGYAMLAHSEHWRCALYVDLVLDQPTGNRFGVGVGVGDCYRVLGRHGIRLHPDPLVRAKAIVTFLNKLFVHQIVHVQYDRYQHWRVVEVEVLADIETVSERRRAEEQRREVEEQLRKATAVETARSRAKWASRASRPRPGADSTTAAPAATSPRVSSPAQPWPTDKVSPPPARYTHCRQCGLPLADVLAADGYHIGC